MKHLFIWALLFVGFNLNAQEQTNGKISGSVKNSEGRPLEAATATLLKAADSALVKIALTDKGGKYELEAPEGRYLLSITSVGYTKQWSGVFSVANGAAVEVPFFTLVEQATGLTGVTVQARRPLVENKIDKMVVNVDASPTNAGNTALEVLEKSPGITVDRDGNISLKGKQGVIVLVDGKQTYLSGQDLANLLRNMPASQLDQIEIMTQPSARFDASGNSGVLNLKTKKNTQKGLNGSVNLSYVQGYYPKSPNSFVFNYRVGKVNFFSNLGYSQWQGFSDQNIVRNFRDQQGKLISVFDQNSRQAFISRNYNARVGADYFIDKKTTLGFVVNGTHNPRNWSSSSNSDIENGSDKVDSMNLAKTTSRNKWQNLGANVNFRRVLDTTGRELTADLDYVTYHSIERQASDNRTLLPNGSLSGNPFLLKGNLPSDITILSGKVDYTHPLKKGAKFEAGVKSSYVTTDNDAQYTLYDHGSEKWMVDGSRSNHFLYKENINAAYVNWSRQFKKFGLQTGLRLEHTHSVGDQKTTGEKTERDYAQLFPTAYVSYALNEKNNFGLSYGRRIERPNYQDMNPFQYFLDQYTYRQGNPDLTPQFTHNIELSHNYRSALNTTINYTTTTDILNDILKQNEVTKVTYQIKENVARRNTIGIAVSYNAPVTKWWTTSMYTNLYNNRYKGQVNDTTLDVGITTFMANMSQQFRFAKTWSAEISAFYRTRAQETGLFLIEPMGVFSVGFGKQILKNKGSIRLNIVDPFWIQKANVVARLGKIDTEVHSKWDNRRAGLTFTYRFSKGQNIQAPNRRTGSAQDEQNRVGGGGN